MLPRALSNWHRTSHIVGTQILNALMDCKVIKWHRLFMSSCLSGLMLSMQRLESLSAFQGQNYIYEDMWRAEQTGTLQSKKTGREDHFNLKVYIGPQKIWEKNNWEKGQFYAWQYKLLIGCSELKHPELLDDCCMLLVPNVLFECVEGVMHS